VAVDDCGAFLAHEDGRVERLPRRWLARHGSGTGRTYGAKLQVRFVGRRLELRVDDRVVWRAARVYRDYGGALAFGPHGRFAFATYRHGLYLAPRGRPERLVLPGRALYPIGYTPRGDLLVALPRARIWLLDARGRVRLRIRYQPHASFLFDERHDTLTWVTPRHRLAQLVDRRIRLSRPIPVLGSLAWQTRDLVGFGGLHVLRVVHRDGRVVAKLWVRRGVLDTGFAAAADGSRFAFRTVLGRVAVGAPVRVYVLRAGAARARLLARYRLGSVGCAQGANFAWHGHLLLYTAVDRKQLVLDTDTGTRTDLATLAPALPRRGAYSTASFSWRADYPA
jgi:hypothetical protein